MLDETGLVLYVGKAKRLRRRLLSYFRARGRRSKAARILRRAHAIDWEYQPTEFGALLRELRLIKQHRPRFNHAMKSDEVPRGYIALTNGAVPALQLFYRSDDPRAEVLYGPFRRLSALAEAARALADATGVRDCNPTSASGTCLRAELGTCACPGTSPHSSFLVPAGRPPRTGRRRGTRNEDLQESHRIYLERVSLARDFLAGRTDAPIGILRERMAAAAEAWEFERAGSLKTKLEQLEWLYGRLRRFRADVDRLTFVYRPEGYGGEARVYLVRRGTVRAEVAAPTTEREEQELATLARRVFDGPDPKGRDIPTHDLDELYLVTAWFRKHPAELERAEPWTAGPRVARTASGGRAE
jgi:excinuclease UvrABC nuclease subunit